MENKIPDSKVQGKKLTLVIRHWEDKHAEKVNMPLNKREEFDVITVVVE